MRASTRETAVVHLRWSLGQYIWMPLRNALALQSVRCPSTAARAVAITTAAARLMTGRLRPAAQDSGVGAS